jgi:hypothetical protein
MRVTWLTGSDRGSDSQNELVEGRSIFEPRLVIRIICASVDEFHRFISASDQSPPSIPTPNNSSTDEAIRLWFAH